MMNTLASDRLLARQSDLMVSWLKEVVYPLWSTKGYDAKSGLFHENLDRSYAPVNGLRRSMVQARQIYVLSALVEMGAGDILEIKRKIAQTLGRYIEVYQTSSGAFSFAVDDGLVRHEGQDLYAQSFALYGLARGYALLKDSAFEASAKKLLNYLLTERRLPQGGFSEIEKGQAVCRSNPHMHLFEAAVEWMIASQDSCWRDLGANLDRHFNEKILGGRDMVAEEFDDEWRPVRNEDGSFFFEPGHHYEWAWLLARYAELSKQKDLSVSTKLYAIANQFGLQTGSDVAVDQVWSNGTVKSATARFWPQGERIKAASYLARKAGVGSIEQANYKKDCLRSVANLLDYLHPLDTGLWNDSRDKNGAIVFGNAKASSLYHITSAIVELNALANSFDGR